MRLMSASSGIRRDGMIKWRDDDLKPVAGYIEAAFEDSKLLDGRLSGKLLHVARTLCVGTDIYQDLSICQAKAPFALSDG